MHDCSQPHCSVIYQLIVYILHLKTKNQDSHKTLSSNRDDGESFE